MLNYTWQRKKKQFLLENLISIKKLYNNKLTTLYSPYPTPKYVKTSQVKSYFVFHLFEDYLKFKMWMIRFEDLLWKIHQGQLFCQTYIKIKEFDYLLKNQQFVFDYTQKIKWLDGKTWWKLVIVFSLLSLLSVIHICYFYGKHFVAIRFGSSSYVIFFLI